MLGLAMLFGTGTHRMTPSYINSCYSYDVWPVSETQTSRFKFQPCGPKCLSLVGEDVQVSRSSSSDHSILAVTQEVLNVGA